MISNENVPIEPYIVKLKTYETKVKILYMTNKEINGRYLKYDTDLVLKK